jgi:hypothetical protein
MQAGGHEAKCAAHGGFGHLCEQIHKALLVSAFDGEDVDEGD